MMKQEDEWTEDAQELHTFAHVLEQCGVFETPKDALAFFEKPWKWSPEYAQWVALGKPLELDDIEKLQPRDEVA